MEHIGASNQTYHPFPDGFCSDTFWDLSTVWYTDNPDFSECFESTALVWGPCAFLWFMLPVQLYVALSRDYRIKRWTWVSVSKTALSMVLAVLAVIDLADVVQRWTNFGRNSVPTAVFVAAFLSLSTAILSAGCIFSDKRRGRSASAILFFFWMFTLIVAIVTFRSRILRAIASNDYANDLRSVSYVLYVIVVTAQFVLSCVGEKFLELETHEKNPCPERNASFLSHLTFWWFNPMAYLGWKRPLRMDDLWTLLPWDCTRVHVENLDNNWKVEMERRKKSLAGKNLNAKQAYEPSLLKALWKTYGLRFVSSGCLRILNDLAVFISPQILQLLIVFVNDPAQPSWKGYLYAALMLIGATIQTSCLNYYLQICFRLGMHVRGSIVAVVYRKALRITSEAKRSSNVGEIVNLMSVDAQRFMDYMAFAHVLWGAPLQIGLALYFLWNLLGIAVLAGLGMMLLMVPVNAFVVSRIRALQLSQMKEKDGRIKMMTEILNGMKVLKLYAWEKSFQDLVTSIRERELVTLRKAAFLNVISYFSWVMAPFLVALATFATYILIDPVNNVLTAERIFVALSLLNILRLPLTMLPNTITLTIQVAIGIQRLTKFLRNDELDLDSVQELPPNDPYAVKISSGSFAWGKQDPVCLTKIELAIKQSQLVAVVGKVGSGKSSLCAAMLGLMEKLSGEVGVKGKVAYVPQQAWIQNLTLKNNILFGNKLDSTRYERTLDACSLRPDLAMLSAGDETEIGERGTNMSGGQRQRISLARAVYSNADVYFLDDPLSAVDAHVGKHIFENVIGPSGMLNGKTRILVTHGIGYLSQTDLIVVLDNGTISETGTFKDLLKRNGAFAEFLRTYLSDAERGETVIEDEHEAAAIEKLRDEAGFDLPSLSRQTSANPGLRDRSTSVVSQTSISSANKIKEIFRRESRQVSKVDKAGTLEKKPAGQEKGKLVEEEKSETGAVKWSVYVNFMRQMSFFAVIGMSVSYGVSYGMSVAANFWLGQWGQDEKLPDRSEWVNFRLGIYALFGGLQGVFVLMGALCLAYGRIRASRTLHQTMLERIMRAPMAFFDTTPMGRIVNRFSKDVDTVDILLPSTVDLWLYCAYSLLSTIIVICVNTPWFSVLVIPLGAFYFFMQRFFIATSRQLKRLEAVSRSPIYSHFQESIGGTSVIVATKQIQRFIDENEHRVDINNASYYPNMVSQRWVAIRLEFVGICVSFFTALYAVIGRDIPAFGVSPDTIGLSISYSLAINQILNWFVRMTSDLESNVVSVERLKEYSDIATEAEWTKPGTVPPRGWPIAGRVEFHDYKTRYRPELDLVLKGVNADIIPGEKVHPSSILTGRFHDPKEYPQVSTVFARCFYAQRSTENKNLYPRSANNDTISATFRSSAYDLCIQVTTSEESAKLGPWLRANKLINSALDPRLLYNRPIGIVGRTGAGKSSLTLALFRIIEASDGSISIDGVNIARLALHDVRSRITILPQEPVLFSGTLRMNLDPFSTFSDQEVWLALENSHLKQFVSTLPEGLNHTVADGGDNYSVGQRQLICLARALLRKTKILVLDEATAAIDLETDDLIQRTISEKFADCTILTIAHRINTIMDSTRIMVLDQGRVKEFDTPKALLSDHRSIFYSLAKTANLAA